MSVNNPSSPQDSLSLHYKRLLKAREWVGPTLEAAPALETPGTDFQLREDGAGRAAREPDLSNGGIQERVADTRAELHRIIEMHLGDESRLHELADRIVALGDTALRVVRDEDDAKLRAEPELLEGLETIVRTDGSRPSFMIRDGKVDRSTSPLGSWGSVLDDSEADLRTAIACVGRIDDPAAPQGFAGTGFLVQEDLILTNRHVLQAIADYRTDGSWTLHEDVCIDFGHEFRARESVGRRKLKRVVFTGSRLIDTRQPIDHTCLDLALIELEPATSAERPEAVLSIEISGEWARAPQMVFTMGYPGHPGLAGLTTFTPTLLDQLFEMTFGCKRLAPGEVITPEFAGAEWTTAHDATTLGGSSGSIMLALGWETTAAALHYGGRTTEPRENWGHVLGRVLDAPDGHAETTLREVFRQHGVVFTDRGRRQPPPGSTRREGLPPTRPRASVDLTRPATLATMVRLAESPHTLDGVEAPGREPVTPAAELAGRNGYTAGFLGGWDIPLPMPQGERANDVRRLRRGGDGAELKYQNFSVVMSKSRRMPMLTAVNINAAESRRLPRIDAWSFDGRLDKEDQWGDELYAGNALDRGHQVRREDPVHGTLEEARRANVDTFHFTNSCPQMAGMNQKTWLSLEDYILKNARADGMRVTVFTGPYFGNLDLEYRGAKIPRAFWKVVAIVTEDGRPSATAYKVDQVRELQELEFVYAGFKTYQISIWQVMEATGIDFGALLKYDGFSQHERTHGVTLQEPLDRLDSIRI